MSSESTGTGAARPTLLVFADSLSYYGPDRRSAVRRSPDLAQYRCRTARLGSRTDRPDRLDLPRRVVGGHPGPAVVGGAAEGGGGGLRDRRHGFAAVAAADGAARTDPLRAATVVAPLGARRLRLGAAEALAGGTARVAAASDRRVPRNDPGAIDFNRPGIPVVASLPVGAHRRHLRQGPPLAGRHRRGDHRVGRANTTYRWWT